MASKKKPANTVKNIKNPTNSKQDMLKWATIVLLIGAATVAHVHWQSIALPLRVSGWIIVLAVALLLAAQTQRGRLVRAFINEAQIELHKVVWPTRQETVQTTTVVAIVVLIMAVLLWVLDSSLMAMIRSLTT